MARTVNQMWSRFVVEPWLLELCRKAVSNDRAPSRNSPAWRSDQRGLPTVVFSPDLPGQPVQLNDGVIDLIGGNALVARDDEAKRMALAATDFRSDRVAEHLYLCGKPL